MSIDRFTLTRQGFENLQRELAELTERQREMSEELIDYRREAGLQPDDEATEYESRVAKEYLDERIRELKTVLERAEVVDEDLDPHRVDLGDHVTLWDMEAHEEYSFDLRSHEEVAFLSEGVSVDSPVGKALLGKCVGDVVEVRAPDGMMRYMIRRIERNPAQT
jgi:transcription elongation factor GreA